MAIRVALNHRTIYHYDRAINLGPQTIRLRPAPHARTPIKAYSLKVRPENHFINWQQDPFSNYSARIVFGEKTELLDVEVEVIAELATINPFDFFVDDSAELFPFDYDEQTKRDLRPFLEVDPHGPKFDEYLKGIDVTPRRTVMFLVDANARLERDIDYTVRLEPGVQTCDQTLTKRSGSCRDSAWLLVQILRSHGIAARFVSGYLIQLASDVKSLDGPSGPEEDFTDLHAWAEAYLPGAGWIGLDPTSGLFASEGHIPLACTPRPSSAAPIDGGLDECEVEFEFSMSVTRIHEDPRVTKPYTAQQWDAIDAVGNQVDADLDENDVRLTMGGEPTFVSIDDMEGAEWTTDAVGPHKQAASVQLLYRLQERFAPGGLLHFGQGKWYPGESLPRWAYTCLWRVDGEPIWKNQSLLANLRSEYQFTSEDAGEFVADFASRLDIDDSYIRPAYEDVYHILETEQKLPVDVDPREFDIESSEDRRRLAQILENGPATPRGFVLPLARAWWQANAKWMSGNWPFRSQRLFLIPGDSPLGLRLPLDSLPTIIRDDPRTLYVVDPLERRSPLPSYIELRQRRGGEALEPSETEIKAQSKPLEPIDGPQPPPVVANDAVQTALCIETRNGRMHVFLPPTGTLEDYLELIAAVEATAEKLQIPVVLEGYLPPHDPRLENMKITPDPGVIEVNVQPTSKWSDLKDVTTGIYEEARQCRLGTEKFQLDGRHAGTGGGNHIVLGGKSTPDSPFLRRPDVLASLITYWNNHPSLSYLFSGLFVGPTSQAPRVDEGRFDAIHELRIAMREIPDMENGAPPPWLVDRIFRHLLVDLTGNTHRAEFCIDKLFSPDSSTGRLGLLEFRAFEMPPHAQMSLAQQLLVRALVCRFWKSPLEAQLTDWGTELHDRFFLPTFLWDDFTTVISDLRHDGYEFENDWFDPHFEFRCPMIGSTTVDGVRIDIRQAIEPWYVLGEEATGGGTARYVDSSLERLEVKATGLDPSRHVMTCNGFAVPLAPTKTAGEMIAGVRYRAWQPPSCLHPTIAVDTPLIFDLVDIFRSRSLGGCQYHIEHPGGLNPGAFPVNSLEAESRRAARFRTNGHTPHSIDWRRPEIPSQYPRTLDLRWAKTE